MGTELDGPSEALARLRKLRMHQQNGVRSPHKPLLVLMALGRLATKGSSELPWSETWLQLAALIEEFGLPRAGGRAAQRAAYPFTRLRSDNVWVLDHEVPDDSVKALGRHRVVGRFEDSIEAALRADPSLVLTEARNFVESHFPATVVPDVLTAVGLDPDAVLRSGEVLPDKATSDAKRRDPRWRSLVLQAWDRQCAFCGYDGQLGNVSAGVEAAHVRWFAFGGPDALDNGLALCALHHKLFDLGVLGLDITLRVQVSGTFTARTDEGKRVYELHDRELRPRSGTPTPNPRHVEWHTDQVFKGQPLSTANAG